MAIPLLLGEGWFPDQPTGLNRYLLDLVLSLERQGVGPRAVVAGPARDAPPHVRVAGHRHDRLPVRLLRLARAASSFARDDVGPDVVDVHFALYGFAPVVLGRLRRSPLVVHFQGPWADESADLGERSGPRLAAKRALERAVYRRARTVVVLSGAFKRLIVERYGVSPWRVQVVPAAVDLERFCPGSRIEARAQLGLSPDVKVAFAVRRLVPRVGIDVLLRAWARRRQGATDDSLLLIAGGGPARDELELLATRLGVGASVRFLGRIPEERLVACYRAADVSVVPTVSMEGFGLVVLEALACGTPVIASDVDALPEVLSSLDKGAIVPAGDAVALAERLSGALAGTDPLPAPARCRRFAESFSLDTLAQRHREIYSAALVGGLAHDRLRVVHVNHSAQLTGAMIGILRLLPALDEVEAHVILGEDGPLVAAMLEMGISVEVLPMRQQAKDIRRDQIRPGELPAATLLHSAAYTARLARRLRALRPDLVHLNSLKAHVFGGLAAKVVGCPVVWHAHDRVAKDYLPAPAVHLMRALAARVPDAVIANSYATLETLGDLSSHGVVNQVIRYPLAIPPTPPPRQHRPPVRFGMVGRISPWKGQHVFLEAFAQAFPDGDARGVIVGGSLFGRAEEDYERHVHETARRLGLEDRVHFTGFVDDVDAQLAQLDVLVHASVIPEPFGQVITEGMAAGLAVVASAAGGPMEVVEHRVNGLLCPPGDVPALAKAMRELADDPELRRRLASGGREKVREFAPERVAAQVMDVYRQVARRTPRIGRTARI